MFSIGHCFVFVDTAARISAPAYLGHHKYEHSVLSVRLSVLILALEAQVNPAALAGSEGLGPAIRPVRATPP